MITKILLYAFMGLLWEILITSYHRSVISQKNLLASLFAVIITFVSLSVISDITKQIISCDNYHVYIYILVFALAKGIGAYLSLNWWSKKAQCDAGDCQRRN